MKQRLLAVLILLCTAVGVGLGGGPTTVHAYPPGCASVTTDASSYAPGGTVTITAKGTAADAGSLVTFTITLQSTDSGSSSSLVVTATANAEGIAIVTITAPSALGTYIVSITNINCGDVSSSFEVDTVTPGTTVPGVPPGLPRAGADPVNWLYSAAIVVFTGFGLWLVARRRRGQRTAA